MPAAWICPRWRPDIVMMAVYCSSGKRSGSPDAGVRVVLEGRAQGTAVATKQAGIDGAWLRVFCAAYRE